MKPTLVSLLAVFVALVTTLSGCGGTPVPTTSSSSLADAAQSLPAEIAPPVSARESEPLVYHLDTRLPALVQESVRANREKLFASSAADGALDKATQWLTPDLNPQEDARIAAIVQQNRLQSETQYREMMEQIPETLSHAQAEEEIRFLFDYLRYGYAGYAYLGGDAVFQGARDAMLQSLAEQPDPIPIYDYKYEILIPGLEPHIVDSHFTLDSYRFTDAYETPFFCYSEQIVFAKTDAGFEAQGEDASLLLSVDGDSPAAWLLPYLDQEGNAVWVVGKNFATGRASPVEIVLQNPKTEEETQRTLTLKSIDFSYRDAFDYNAMGYQLEEVEGVPVMINRRLYTTSGDPQKADAQLSAMLDDAEKLREEPVLIIDLRGNAGGDDSYCFRWAHSYTGAEVQPQYASVSTSLLTRTVRDSANWITEYFGDASQEAEKNDPPYWRPLAENPVKLVANENLVFVLIDNAVASSGESFVATLQEMENVVLVGTNTAGCGTVGNIRTVFLPESKLALNCGFTLFLQPDLSPFEGIGYAPDLWTPPGESLERVLALIRNMDLEAAQ